MKKYRCYLFFLFYIGLVSCSSMTNYKGERKFQSRIKAFAHAIRWSKFEEAQGFIRQRNKQALNQNQDYFNQIKVTKYEPLSEVLKENVEHETTDIVSIYTIDYYHKGSYKLVHKQYEQLWWYDDDIGAWFLNTELPVFE